MCKVIVIWLLLEFLIIVASCFTIPSSTTDISNVVATTELIPTTSQKTRYEQGLEDYDEAKENMRQSRGMMMDEIVYHDDHTKEPPKEESKAVADDPWEGYYDFLINEGSFKFWAAFQLVTAGLLVYSAFAAVYYAKFNVITTDYDYYDDFYGRGRANTESPMQSLWSGLSSQTFQRIMDAISSKKYT